MCPIFRHLRQDFAQGNLLTSLTKRKEKVVYITILKSAVTRNSLFWKQYFGYTFTSEKVGSISIHWEFLPSEKVIYICYKRVQRAVQPKTIHTTSRSFHFRRMHIKAVRWRRPQGTNVVSLTKSSETYGITASLATRIWGVRPHHPKTRILPFLEAVRKKTSFMALIE